MHLRNGDLQEAEKDSAFTATPQETNQSKAESKSLVSKIDAKLSFGFFVLLFESIHLDILIPAFVNIKSLEFSSF